MSLIHSDEQRMLADMAREFLAAKSPVAAQRRLRDERVANGFDPALWREIVDLGWTGIPFPEAVGGLEFGYKALGAVFEEMGRTLCASPMFSVVVSGALLQHAGTPAQQAEWLSALIAGDKRVALALDEGPRHDPLATALSARREGGGYRLDGSKVFVVDGIGADAWLVAARTAGQPGDRDGVSLFLITAGTAGVSVSPQSLIDSRNHARLRLDSVLVPASTLVGDEGQGFAMLDGALDRGRACLAAEMLGAAEQLFATTLDYLRTRVQFDAPIGSFQALQHRAARCYTDLCLARSAVMAALAAFDDAASDAATRGLLASLAKWKAGEVAAHVSNEAVQMHGGIGVTDELDVGLFLKRIRVAQACLGDGDFHCQRYGAFADPAA